MSVKFLIGDVHEELAKLPSNYFDCVCTSPPYWGLRSYLPDDDPKKSLEIGQERTLGEHLDVMVRVFREVRRVLKPQGTCWLNYGDCYAASPNGRPAADVVGDDRSFRDKPFSTVGPVYDPAYATPRGSFATGNRSTQRDHGGRIVAGGYLKPKDLAMIPNRLAIALQDDGWWVRSEIIWHKPNPMPESVYDRPTTSHEKVWLLTKSEDYFYNAIAAREPVTPGPHVRARIEGRDTGVGFDGVKRVKEPGANSRMNVDRVPRARKLVVSEDRKDLHSARYSRHRSSVPGGQDLRANPTTTRNWRNVWKITPKAFRDAHFATFPPELVRRCLLAGAPTETCGLCGDIPHDCGGLCVVAGRHPGRVLDPFGGAGTVGLVALELGLDCTLIELNPDYAAMAERRIFGLPKPAAAE